MIIKMISLLLNLPQTDGSWKRAQMQITWTRVKLAQIGRYTRYISNPFHQLSALLMEVPILFTIFQDCQIYFAQQNNDSKRNPHTAILRICLP